MTSRILRIHGEVQGVFYRAWSAGQARSLGLDERFLRYWEFYLCYCEGGFLEHATSDEEGAPTGKSGAKSGGSLFDKINFKSLVAKKPKEASAQAA